MAAVMVDIQTLAYRIVLPDFDPVTSGYAYALSVTRHGGGTQVLVADQQGVPALARTQAAPKGKPDYDPGTLKSTVSAVKKKGDPQVIEGAISLNSEDRGGNDVEMAVLQVKYYPDRLDEYGFAEVTLQEKP